MSLILISLVFTLLIASGSSSPFVKYAFISHRTHPKHSATWQQFQTSNYLEALSTQQTLRTLYPSIQPFKNDSIKVSALHTLQYQLYGNPNGLPALFLHGGPGAGCFPNHARFFDADKYCIVLLNQRGVNEIGKGEIRENDLLQLAKDCEMLRDHLNFVHWNVVLGGSWGTTLALAYAQEYPDRVKSMILRGVCLLRPKEINWLLGRDGVATLDPEGYQEFCQGINGTEETNVLEEYYHRLLSSDPKQRLEAAKGWMRWEMRVSSIQNDEKDAKAPILVGNGGSWRYVDAAGNECLMDDLQKPTLIVKNLTRTVPDRERIYQATFLPIQVVPGPPTNSSNASTDEYARFIPAQAMLTCFYSINHDYCLNHIDLLSSDRMAKVQSIPTIVIHGGLDAICPVNNALDLADVWPALEVRVCTKAGHSMYDATITNELIHATDRLSKLWETSAVFE